jgi:linoleate 9S-lipoxygenase
MFPIFNTKKKQKIRGTVVLMSKNALDLNDIKAGPSVMGAIGLVRDIAGSVVDGATAFLSASVGFQLISATKTDRMGNGFVGNQFFLEKRIPLLPTLAARQDAFNIYFEWDNDFGVPGAFYIKNYMQSEFYLVSLTLDDIPGHDSITFLCNSWVYNSKLYRKDRIFFANKPYLPNEMPEPLVNYRDQELDTMRGDGTGRREEWDRIYDYDVYNDLGNPDKNRKLARPILGGSKKFPYPRRGRTGRKPTKTDAASERPAPDTTYVPRDEVFGHLKQADFLGFGLKGLNQNVIPQFRNAFDFDKEFDSFEEVRSIFEGGIKLPTDLISAISPIAVVKELFRTDGEQFLKFPTPHIIQVDKSAWMTDEEFAREMLAGVNPCVIQRLQEFPPQSKLDPKDFGDQTSTITKQHLEINMDGLSVEKAIQDERLFILNYHDAFLPYLKWINKPVPKSYATRTILFLKDDGTLKPLAIELSLSHPNGEKFGAVSKVMLPPEGPGVEKTIWQLAKAYVVVNDACYHQLMSHWLNTHCAIEPFIIATNRCLSVVHPIHKLLQPHYRDTMNINALARSSLISAAGIIEQAFLPGEYAVEMSSVVYKDWVFPDQALPADLIKRGLAVEDPSAPHGLRLVIKDYPYAVDGLEVWHAIKTWVKDYVTLYYKTDAEIQRDPELQEFWKEAVEIGHGDHKDKPWWPLMNSIDELVESCSIIIWLASAFHAAVNFGQYPFGGLILNRPTMTRRLIPEPGTKEYDEMVVNDQRAYLRTITPKAEAMIDLTVIEILSRHASDEVYLGTRENKEWTSDERAITAFKRFGNKMAEIEETIERKNKDPDLLNRNGPAKVPYTLLCATSKEGLTNRGIPNSVSI